MKNLPRILPLLGVAMGGVIAVNALSGAKDLPGMLSGARAFAEEAAGKAAPGKKDGASKGEAAATGEASEVAALPAPTIQPRAVCAPTAAELAKQAGLSPAELQVLQSLGERRGVVEKREEELSTQLGLMAAAEAKLDAKIKALNSLKGEVQGLLTQTDAKQAAEIDRLVKVFEGMKAKDAAPRLTALDDTVRIQIAAKMKERALSAIVAQMPPAEAAKLTGALARRFSDAKAAAEKAQAAAASPAPAPAAAPAKAPAAKAPPRKTAAKAPPRKAAPAAQQAAADPKDAAADAPKPAAPAPQAAAPAAAPATAG